MSLCEPRARYLNTCGYGHVSWSAAQLQHFQVAEHYSKYRLQYTRNLELLKSRVSPSTALSPLRSPQKRKSHEIHLRALSPLRSPQKRKSREIRLRALPLTALASGPKST